MPRKRSGLARYKQRAPFGTGRSKRAKQRADDAAEAAQIRQTHDRVWARDPWCRLCQGRRGGWLPDQMHEDPPRSQTRGLPPAERFSTRVCCRLCQKCHGDVTEHRLRIRFVNPELGFDAPVVPEKV